MKTKQNTKKKTILFYYLVHFTTSTKHKLTCNKNKLKLLLVNFAEFPTGLNCVLKTKNKQIETIE